MTAPKRLAPIARELGVQPETIVTRLRAGWSEQEAMSTPNQAGRAQPSSHPWKRRRFGRGNRNTSSREAKTKDGAS